MWIGTTWAFFQSEGNFLSLKIIKRQSLKNIDSGMYIEFPHNFIIHILIISWLWALFGSKLLIILEALSVEKLTVSSDLLVSFARLLGKTLLLFNRVHWFAKKVLKSLAYSLKFVANLFSWNRRGIQRMFLLFRKTFKMHQYFFRLVAALANWLVKE